MHFDSICFVAQEGAVKGMQYATVATVVQYEHWTASIHSIASLDLTNNTIVLGNPIDPNWAGGASGVQGRKGRREGGGKGRREGGRKERREGGRKREKRRREEREKGRKRGGKRNRYSCNC
jgi:hypothetical protein